MNTPYIKELLNDALALLRENKTEEAQMRIKQALHQVERDVNWDIDEFKSISNRPKHNYDNILKEFGW